jgi:hypothetical protein
MATDYDAPRRGEVDEMGEDSLEELKARRAEAQSGSIDVDETELNESLELPGADLSSLSGEELTVRVLPKQDDEFTCASCFLVHHRSRLAREKNGQPICRDCAEPRDDIPIYGPFGPGNGRDRVLRTAAAGPKWSTAKGMRADLTRRRA